MQAILISMHYYKKKKTLPNLKNLNSTSSKEPIPLRLLQCHQLLEEVKVANDMVPG